MAGVLALFKKVRAGDLQNRLGCILPRHYSSFQEALFVV